MTVAEMADSERTIWALAGQVRGLVERLAEVEAERDLYRDKLVDVEGQVHELCAEVRRVEAERDELQQDVEAECNLFSMRDRLAAVEKLAFGEGSQAAKMQAIRELLRGGSNQDYSEYDHDAAARGDAPEKAGRLIEEVRRLRFRLAETEQIAARWEAEHDAAVEEWRRAEAKLAAVEAYTLRGLAVLEIEFAKRNEALAILHGGTARPEGSDD